MTGTFKHKMHYTKDRGKFMEEVVDIMNNFSRNKRYLTEVYSKMEDDMEKEEGLAIIPFEAAALALIENRSGNQYKYSTALYNYIYWEYESITHKNTNHPFMFDCLTHAINYIECNGLSAFQKKYTKRR